MIDAYVWTTPNGFKLLVALEELGLPYTTHWVDITKGEQHAPAFLEVNPNAKIPAIVDDGQRVFESGAVLTYLADKTGKLLAASGPERYEALSWVFFNVAGPGPMLGQLGFFKKFAKEQVPMAIERYQKEAERLYGVLDKRLEGRDFLVGDSLTIADIINFTWPHAVRSFLSFDPSPWPNLTRWLDTLAARPAFAKALALKP